MSRSPCPQRAGSLTLLIDIRTRDARKLLEHTEHSRTDGPRPHRIRIPRDPSMQQRTRARMSDK